MIKRLIVVVLWPLLASAQNGSPTPAQTQSPGPVPAADATPGSEPSQSAESVVDQIERLLRERENAESSSTAQLPPDKPRTHRFTNQPIGKVLRILAEQAGINYVEPNIPADERISVALVNLTPLQAFYQIAESRGFQVITDGQRYSLRRSDIESPSFYITKRYFTTADCQLPRNQSNDGPDQLSNLSEVGKYDCNPGRSRYGRNRLRSKPPPL
jgi:hypothetical protein